MSGVFTKVFSSVDHVSLASEVVDSVGDALGIDWLLGTLSEVFWLFEAVGLADTVFEHLAWLLAERWVRFFARFGILFPGVFQKSHYFN